MMKLTDKIRLVLLSPIGCVYGAIALIRRGLYTFGVCKRFQPAMPTICIGNLALGGTGKTPHTEYLVKLLSPQYRLATLSRGYKRQSRGYLSTAENPSWDVLALGDEPMQFHRKFPELQVAVCEQRAEGLRRLAASQNPPEVVLLDDAFQHLQVRCGLNILLTDFARPYHRDLPVPAGNLREFRSAARSADIVIVTKCPANLTEKEADLFRKKNGLAKHPACFFTTYIYDALQPITPAAQNFHPNEKTKVRLLAGIANPKPIVAELQRQFTDVEVVAFPDHHQFTEKEMLLLSRELAESGENSIVVTTEKDATRLTEGSLKKIVSLQPFFTIPVSVGVMFNKENVFNNIVKSYVRENRLGSD